MARVVETKEAGYKNRCHQQILSVMTFGCERKRREDFAFRRWVWLYQREVARCGVAASAWERRQAPKSGSAGAARKKIVYHAAPSPLESSYFQ
jgi:hypothetical protein